VKALGRIVFGHATPLRGRHDRLNMAPSEKAHHPDGHPTDDARTLAADLSDQAGQDARTTGLLGPKA